MASACVYVFYAGNDFVFLRSAQKSRIQDSRVLDNQQDLESLVIFAFDGKIDFFDD